jgi:2-dehydropantoate 2-reductase
MRILVMGAGGLGGYFGGLLAASGADVTFVARGANLQALQTRGLTVRSVHGDFSLSVQACADPGHLLPVDVVLFCVKTYDVTTAAALLQPVVAPHTVLITLQNGVDTPYDLQTAFGRGTVLAGMTRIGTTLVAPGVIEQPTTDRAIEFGSLDGQAQTQVDKISRLFDQAGIPVVVSADIQKSLWEKLVFISAFSGLATLTGLPVATILAHERTRDLYRSVLRESAEVAWTGQINVAPDIVDQSMHYLDTSGDPGESSMAVDFRRRRRIEVEAIHGAVVRHGQRLQVPTPVNATLYAALTVMDQHNRQTTSGNT